MFTALAESTSDYDSHLGLCIYASDVPTIPCTLPGDGPTPILWIHNGGVVAGCPSPGKIHLWDTNGRSLQTLDHGDRVSLGVTV